MILYLKLSYLKQAVFGKFSFLCVKAPFGGFPMYVYKQKVDNIIVSIK